MIDKAHENFAQEISSKKKTILKNGLILTKPGSSAVEVNRYTVLEDDIIGAINSAEEPEDCLAEVIDCSGSIILPGFVNCHNHTPMSLLRGLSDDLPLDKWLSDYIFPIESRFVNPEFVGIGARLSMMEMLLSGTTTVADAYFFMESVAEAANDLGIRAIVAQGIVDFPTPDTNDKVHWKERIGRFLDTFQSGPLTQPALFCHSPYLCGEKTFIEAHEIAGAKNMLLFSHVSETRSEVQDSIEKFGSTPFERLATMGALGPNFVAVHAVHVTDEDRQIIRDNGVGIIHCPRSNLKLSSGLAHVKKFRDLDIRVGIGTDGPASNNNLDMIEELRSAALISKIVGCQEDAMSAEDVLAAGTYGGASALGLEHVIGSLEAGKYADVIIVNLNSPHLAPAYNPHSMLVYSSRGSDVRDVFVHGRHVVRDREITTIDGEGLMRETEEIARSVSKSSGVPFWGKR